MYQIVIVCCIDGFHVIHRITITRWELTVRFVIAGIQRRVLPFHTLEKSLQWLRNAIWTMGPEDSAVSIQCRADQRAVCVWGAYMRLYYGHYQICRWSASPAFFGGLWPWLDENSGLSRKLLVCSRVDWWEVSLQIWNQHGSHNCCPVPGFQTFIFVRSFIVCVLLCVFCDFLSGDPVEMDEHAILQSFPAVRHVLGGLFVRRLSSIRQQAPSIGCYGWKCVGHCRQHSRRKCSNCDHRLFTYA